MRAEIPNHLQKFGSLLRQYDCHQWSKVATQRLRYIRFRQETLRSASSRQAKQLPHGSTTGTNIGRRVILLPTFSGRPMQLEILYQDATEVVRTHGRPLLFITFACNHSSPEIIAALLPHHTADRRPDITARVFRLKIDALLKDMAENGARCKVVARMCVLEFQKRGHPQTITTILRAP